MNPKLLIDPWTKRVIFICWNDAVPIRVTVLDGENQRHFSPFVWEVVKCPGALPADIHIQNCFEFVYTPEALKRVSNDASEKLLRSAG